MWGATYISYPFQKTLLVPASALSCVSCVHFSWLCTFHAHVYACKYFFNPFFQKWHKGTLTQPHIFSFWWRPGRKSSLTEWWSWTALSSLAGRHSNRPRGWTMPFLRVVGIDIWCNKRYNKNISGVLSAKHGLLFYDNQRFWFKDTNSRNGSWLNNVQIKAEQTVVLKEGDLLQLGRDSPTDKQILGKIKLFYPHEDSSLIPSSCAVLADTEDIQESSLEKTASFESLIEQLRKIEKRTPYEEDRFQRLQHADDHMKLFGSDIKEAHGSTF